jgi:hypothetical protein
MPAGRRDITQSVLLLQGFLDPVFANIHEPGFHRGADRLRSMRLGDRNYADRMSPASPGLMEADALPDFGDSRGKPREGHNL